jgi:O-antigen/teichoic acid export membrane protein
MKKKIQQLNFEMLAIIPLVSRIAGLFGTFLFTLFVAKLFGAEIIGLYSLAMAFVNILLIVCVFGFDVFLVKVISTLPGLNIASAIGFHLYRAVIISSTVSVFIAVIGLLLSETFAEIIFQNSGLRYYFTWSFISLLPISILKILTATLRGMSEVLKYSILDSFFIPMFSFGFLLLGIFMIGYDSRIPILAYFLGVITSLIIAVIWVRRMVSFPNAISLIQTGDEKYPLFSVSLPMMVTSSMGLLLVWSDTLMIGALLNESQVGVYSVSAKIANLGGLILASINVVVAPRLAKIYKNGDSQKLIETVQRATLFTIIFTIPSLILIALSSTFLLDIIGSQFHEGRLLILILLTGQLISAIAGPVGYLLNMTGHHLKYNACIVSASIINILLNYTLIIHYGIIGAAVATAISLGLLNILSVIFVNRIFRFWTFSILSPKKHQL